MWDLSLLHFKVSLVSPGLGRCELYPEALGARHWRGFHWDWAGQAGNWGALSFSVSLCHGGTSPVPICMTVTLSLGGKPALVAAARHFPHPRAHPESRLAALVVTWTVSGATTDARLGLVPRVRDPPQSPQAVHPTSNRCRVNPTSNGFRVCHDLAE